MKKPIHQITMMTYNIRIDCDQGEHAWQNRVDKIAEVIKRYHPVIVSTQEGNARMLNELMELLPDYSRIGKGRMADYSDEHCAILYRTSDIELLEEGQFWLSETPEAPGSVSWDSSYPRICTWARVNYRGSLQPLLIYNTHLDHMSQRAREQGMLLITEHISHRMNEEEQPFVLMGDFNSEPSNPVIRFLKGMESITDVNMSVPFHDVFEQQGQQAGLTFHNYEGGEEGEPIDYIFASQSLRIKCAIVCRDKVAEQHPSDHYPVVCELEW